MRKRKQIIMLYVLTLIAFATNISAQSAQEEYRQGKDLFNKGQSREAFKLLKSSADRGHAPAMNAIGYCYQYGKGVSKNNTNALQWYMNAATHGDAAGAYNYGWMHLKGVGTKKDINVAKKWITSAANAGHTDAKTILKQEGWLNEKPKQTQKSKGQSKKNVNRPDKPKTKVYKNTNRTTKKHAIKIRKPYRDSWNKSNWYAGQWDSNIYNLIDHPKTVALRVEVLDSETRLPLEDAQVLFKGTYMTKERTSRHPDGEQRAQEQEFELATRTGKDGIAIAALGWRKEYPWRRGTDEIEKVQSIEALRKGYRFVKQNTPFKRFLDVGQNKNSDSQEPRFFKMFEETWAKECSRSNVKFCTLRFRKHFSDLDNKNSIHPEFFEKIRNKEWGIVYKGPINRTQWEDKDQRLCGPYLIYTIRLYMDRIKHDQQSRKSSSGKKDDSISNTSNAKKESPQNPSSSVKIKSLSEAKRIIERNLSKRNRGSFRVYDSRYDTELQWDDEQRNGTCYAVKVPKNIIVGGYSMRFSYSGNVVKISHQNPKPRETIVVTPVNSRGQYKDDQYPTSVNLYASSANGAREITKALVYLESIKFK